jgi:hypothetical protein
MGILEAFFEAHVESSLARTTVRVPVFPRASTALATLHGVVLGDALGRLVDTLAERPSDALFGPFGAFEPRDWLPGSGENALVHALAEPFRREALVTGTVALGPNGNGDIWLFAMEACAGKHEVYVLRHDTLELHPVADSVEAFFFLMSSLAHGTSPSAEEQLALQGRVRAADEADVKVPSGVEPFVPKTPLAARRATHDALVSVLSGLASPDELPRPEAPRGSSASDIACALLGAYLTREDALVDNIASSHREHAARLVRDAAQLLGATDKPASVADRGALLGLELN